MQPEVDPWDWAPGALLVREAGGEAKVVQGGARWHLAGPAALVAELEGLIR
jgi:myo-inositol-1(or 4)-monophosphatase